MHLRPWIELGYLSTLVAASLGAGDKEHLFTDIGSNSVIRIYLEPPEHFFNDNGKRHRQLYQRINWKHTQSKPLGAVDSTGKQAQNNRQRKKLHQGATNRQGAKVRVRLPSENVWLMSCEIAPKH